MQRFAHGDGGAPSWGSPEWAARREVEVLKLLCDGNVSKMQNLWLRKQSVVANSRQLAGGQPRPKQQSRAALPELEPAAQPKQQTQAQAARRARSQKRLCLKHLAKRLWACVRVAARLKAWRVRARRIGAPEPHGQAGRRPLAAAPALFDAEGRFGSVCGACKPVPQHRPTRKVLPDDSSAERPAVAAAAAAPATVVRTYREMMEEKAARARRSPTAQPLPAPPPPASLMAAPAPPGRPGLDSEQLAAAARETLDDSELQDFRGSKRDATARTPPPHSDLVHPHQSRPLRLPPTAVKKSRGGAACPAATAFDSPVR